MMEQEHPLHPHRAGFLPLATNGPQIKGRLRIFSPPRLGLDVRPAPRLMPKVYSCGAFLVSLTAERGAPRPPTSRHHSSQPCKAAALSLESLEGERLCGCRTQVLTGGRTGQAEERPGPAVAFPEGRAPAGKA